MQLYRAETEALSQFSHPNVVRFLKSSEFSQLHSARTTKRITYIATELVNGHELMEYAQMQVFSEPTAKYFFRQMLSGLKHIHDNGFSHR